MHWLPKQRGGFTLIELLVVTRLRKLRSLRRGKSAPSFTLIELLVVIGILAILTAAVVLVLNPSELLKQGRDSKRSTDIASIHKAIQLLITQSPSVSLGAASTVSISIPDTSSTCANLSLPTLPTGYTYRCVPQASSTLINGSGWLPIDFTQTTIQNFSSLPLDPANTSTTELYYAYMPTTAGTYELTTLMESEKGSRSAIVDGGIFPGVLEVGSALAQTPPLRDRGLVGYWPLDEGTGTTAYDRSGNNNNGTLVNNPTWQTSTNCKRGSCLSFDGSTNYINIGNQGIYNLTNGVSIVALVKTAGVGPVTVIRRANQYMIRITVSKGWGWSGSGTNVAGTSTVSNSQWHQMVFTASKADGTQKLYVDGVLEGQNTDVGLASFPSDSLYIGSTTGNMEYFGGLLDDIRIYNRALSQTEIIYMYNAIK